MLGPSSRHRRSLCVLLADVSVQHPVFRHTLLFQLLEPCLWGGTGHFRLFRRGTGRVWCSIDCELDGKLLVCVEFRLWLPMLSLYIPAISLVVEHPARVVDIDTRRA